MKLWDKGQGLDQQIEAFTVGMDRQLDEKLAPYDILGSLAHTQMLTEVGLLPESDFQQLRPALIDLYHLTEQGDFSIGEGIEDVHSEVEVRLTQKLGEAGKKIHSGRSRNDQVLVDLKLFMIAEIEEITQAITTLFQTLQSQSKTYQDILLPGYTHLQVAMPSSFGLWFGAFAEALIDDVSFWGAAFEVADQNPLGSAAGYGSSFPLDRQRTTELLGFRTLAYNVVYAQMGRGKLERSISYAISSLATTLNKLASDVCLYMSQNFGFVSLPDSLTTGSSIMPHKKNPDVFEILRARTNRLQALPGTLGMITTNLPSGYHRDLQLTKEVLLPALDELKDSLAIAQYAISHLAVNREILADSKYAYLFSVEAVNQLVLQGIPFREAYVQIGKQIASGEFTPRQELQHTHLGSMHNLAHEAIAQKLAHVHQRFDFQRFRLAWKALLRN